ncbi:hypothetical protein BHE74_00008226 [Ensete ventricosum]|nr:hypothetical protein GW17_00031137 [Ensete ventricosum]RWW83271.1 hypothetical protein BHE74_00008226 [Ensete ventricosum]RZS07083.1 hypothetical protein BHM03_00037844 [Ensete ventricosum]
MTRPAAAKAPCKGAAGCYQGQPTSVVAHTGSSPKGDWLQGTRGHGNACRGGAREGAADESDRPFEGWLSAGKGSRRLRRGDGGGIVSVREEG